MDDPKARLKRQDDTDELREQIASLQEMVNALLQQKASSGGIDADTLEAIMTRVAKVSADAQAHAINPSNPDHLHISAYSYPEGDLVRPRALKCKMFWVGYEIDLDITAAHEIELLNLATPGTYTFTRTDGLRRETLTITGEYAPDGVTLTKLYFDFPAREDRDSLPTLANMLRQAFKVPTEEQRRIAELEAQLAALQPALVTA